MPVLEREVFNVLDLPVQDLMPDMEREGGVRCCTLTCVDMSRMLAQYLLQQDFMLGMDREC